MANKVTNVTIVTSNSNDPITISADILYGHAGTTTFLLNHIALPAKSDSFSGMMLGTNNGLRHNTLIVTTAVAKKSPTSNCEVDYTVDGALTPSVTQSILPFSGTDIVNSHTIIYSFV